MPKVKYIGAIDEVDVVLLNATLKRGEDVEVTAEQAKALLAQPDNFESVTEKKKG